MAVEDVVVLILLLLRIGVVNSGDVTRTMVIVVVIKVE